MSINDLFRYLFRTPQRADDGLNLRAWFAFYTLYMAAVCIACSWASGVYFASGVPWAKTLWYMGLCIFYLSLACTYIPLNTAWIILLLASPSGGLTALSPLARILTIAGAGALATAISHTNEYHVFSYLLRLGKIHQIKETRFFLQSEAYFKSWPFGLLVIFNVFPLPADPARWLATMSRYPLARYFLAQWLGRFIRYGTLAWIGKDLSFKQVILVSVLLVLVSFTAVLVRKWRGKKTPVAPEPTQG